MNQHTEPHPARSTQTTVTALAAVAAPILLLASTVAYVAAGDGMNAGELGGAVQVWAFVAIGVAVAGLCRTFEHLAPRAAVAVTVLGIVAAAVGSGYAIDSIQAAVFDTGSLQETDSGAVPFALQIPGLMAPLALAVLGVMLARTGVAPKALAWLLVLSAALFPASRIPDVEGLAIASDLLLVASLAPIGLRLLGGRATPAPVQQPTPAMG